MTVKILFIAPNRLGDAVTASGLIEQCRHRYPKAAFTIACGPVAAPLFAALPGLTKLLVLQKSAGWQRWRHWADLLAVGWGQTWDWVIDLRGSASAFILPTWRRRIWRGGRKYDEQHRVAAFAGFLMPQDQTPPKPHIWLADGHRAAAAKILAGDGRPVLAVAPTANWIGKTWPVARFIAVAQALIAADGPLAGGRVLVLAGPGEAEVAAPLLAAFQDNDSVDLVDQVDLLTLAACLAEVDLFIGNDSGLMHVAAAVGAPTLGLFGPSRDDLYRPWGAGNQVVRTPEAYAELMPNGRPCAPDTSLMTGLSVEAVLAAAEGLVKNSPVR